MRKANKKSHYHILLVYYFMDISSYGIIWTIMKITSYHKIRMKPFYSVRSNINPKITLLHEYFWKCVFLKQILHSLSSLRLRLQTPLSDAMSHCSTARCPPPRRTGPTPARDGSLNSLDSIKKRDYAAFSNDCSPALSPLQRSPHPSRSAINLSFIKLGRHMGEYRPPARL